MLQWTIPDVIFDLLIRCEEFQASRDATIRRAIGKAPLAVVGGLKGLQCDRSARQLSISLSDRVWEAGDAATSIT
jgi:hypothetical protein